MSDTPWKREGIRRLDGPDHNGVVEAEELVRLAYVGNPNEGWGEVGRNVGVGVASGAIGGAVMGGLPGAAVGAGINAAGQLGMAAYNKLRYFALGDSGKAITQAEFITYKVGEMASQMEKWDQKTAQHLKSLAKQYEDMIRVVAEDQQIENKDKNRFLQDAQTQQQQFLHETNEILNPSDANQAGQTGVNTGADSSNAGTPGDPYSRTSSTSKKFVRLAQQQISPTGTYFRQNGVEYVPYAYNPEAVSAGQAVWDFTKTLGREMAPETVIQPAAQGIITKAVPQAFKAAVPQVSTPKAGLVDMAANAAITFGIEAFKEARGALVNYQEFLPDVSTAIKEINNRLKDNAAKSKIEMAGNVLWSWLNKGKEILEQKMQQAQRGSA